jgi:hypothetical protein
MVPVVHTGSKSRHVSVSIDRTAVDVYDYASDPGTWPEWSARLGASRRRVEHHWVAESPMGRVVVDLAERNEYGVLDHTVTMPSGEVVYNPMRVLTDGDGSEVVPEAVPQPSAATTRSEEGR